MLSKSNIRYLKWNEGNGGFNDATTPPTPTSPTAIKTGKRQPERI